MGDESNWSLVCTVSQLTKRFPMCELGMELDCYSSADFRNLAQGWGDMRSGLMWDSCVVGSQGGNPVCKDRQPCSPLQFIKEY